jgi:hypothetical protein
VDLHPLGYLLGIVGWKGILGLIPRIVILMDLYVPLVCRVGGADDRSHLDLSTRKSRMSFGLGRGLERCKIAWGKQRAELGGSQDRWFNPIGQQNRTDTKSGLGIQSGPQEFDTIHSRRSIEGIRPPNNEIAFIRHEDDERM